MTAWEEYQAVLPATATRLAEAIGQAIGEASMCWSPTPTGVFDSTRASSVLDDLCDQVVTILSAAQPPTVREGREL